MNKRIIIGIIITSVFLSCKKDAVKAPTSYTLVVTNTALGVTAGTSFTNSGTVNQNARGIYYVMTDQPVTVGKGGSTDNVLKTSYNYTKGVYSLFVVGDSVNTETIFKAETDLPFIANDKNYTSADSVVNIRFANFSPNSVPLKIKVSTATTNEEDAIAYKTIGTWRPFKAAPAATTTYSIQIRRADTDALLTTYSFAANATKRFKNVMIVIRGAMGVTSGAQAFGVSEINYF